MLKAAISLLHIRHIYQAYVYLLVFSFSLFFFFFLPCLFREGIGNYGSLQVPFLPVNCHDFLGNIVDRFSPVTFSIVLNSMLFLLLDWLTLKAKEPSLPSWFGQGEMDSHLSKMHLVVINATGKAEI